ncbi:uncharacterized protein LOC124436850 [Xenia sp. Carnegie-2017]|uniref:uncharacterized protein LOC124436850 n=1 Tax=Xenia sp. Carnegie-2017 TaxID=2897299 RepID=UPI001F045853|nr:uncharacterized protein LOC124436850 [Xenia sp. Carnegie-2017]
MGIFQILTSLVLASHGVSSLLPEDRCPYPLPAQGNLTADYNDYFYGSLSLWPGLKKRDIVKTFRLTHSVLLFRGKVFEWGSEKYKWPEMGRPSSSCKLKWNYEKKGRSRCSLDEIEVWNSQYEAKYSRYRLITNNCHHYVNRLADKLKTNCLSPSIQDEEEAMEPDKFEQNLAK